MKDTLEKIFQGAELTTAEADALFTSLLDESVNPLQVAAVLTAYRMRLPSLAEVLGFRQAALRVSKKVDLSEYGVFDVCGTGGDGKSTFNISTATGVVLAACGIKVAKHGGGAVSSKVGSSNLLEALGYKFSEDAGKLKRELDETGICFLHAPLFHPAFRNVAPVRKDLGFRTVFNMLGPLLNPAEPDCQMIGVYSLDLLRMYSQLSERLGKNYTILHTLDGCDEVSLTSSVKVCSMGSEDILSPQDFGMPYNTYADLDEGGDIAAASRIFLGVLDNTAAKAQRNVVIANAATALFYIERQKAGNRTLADFTSMASEAIESGKAGRIFSRLIELQG